MSFIYRDRKDSEFSYSNAMEFSHEELKNVHDYYDFLSTYIADKESELARLRVERKAALFTLKKFGIEV